MPWQKTAADRQRDAQVYGDPEYIKNRSLARKRANGRCEQCNHRHSRLQCDHDTPVSQGGGHALANLKMLCVGIGSCKCHERKTAYEGKSAQRREKSDPDCTPRTAW